MTKFGIGDRVIVTGNVAENEKNWYNVGAIGIIEVIDKSAPEPAYLVRFQIGEFAERTDYNPGTDWWVGENQIELV